MLPVVNCMKKLWLISGILLAACFVAAGLALMYNLPIDIRDRSPVQPIAFSHKLHAGDNGIPCLFCYRYAPRSPVAGIPTVATCRACHLYISPEAPEIKKLMVFWNNKQPISWVRVYGLPDHVYFPHMMHIRAGLACTACHGEVASMTRITRSVDFKMGGASGVTGAGT